MTGPALEPGALVRVGSFVGRRRDLDSLATALGDGARLLTLVGPPGIGKTRLGTELARAESGRSPERRWVFCELAPARNLGEMLTRVAAAVRSALKEEVDASVPTIGAALAGGGKLALFLDNFEQLPFSARQPLEVWLATAHPLQILATSRDALGLAGEWVYNLAPPPIDEAVELFRLRSGARAPGDLPEMIEEVVRRLECLPLAIELAAARARVLGVHEVARRLAEHFDLVRSHARDDRHASLHAAVEWSWDLLAPYEREVLQQAAVFRGGFSLEAAQTVIDIASHQGAPPVAEILIALVERSLLRARPTRGAAADIRYVFYEYILAYARRRLHADAGRPLVEARHSQYFVERGEAWDKAYDGPNGAAALAWQEMELDNLLCVHERDIVAQPAMAARAVLASFRYAYGAGLLQGHLPYLEAAVAAARRAGDDALLSRTAAVLAVAGLENGNLDLARRHLRDALRAAKRAGAADLQGYALTATGVAHALHGDHAAAIRLYQRAFMLYTTTNNQRASANVLANLAESAHNQGRLKKARAQFERSLAWAQAAGVTHESGDKLLHLGAVCHEEQDYDEARRRYNEAVAHSTTARIRSRALTHLALLELELRHLDNAVSTAREAVAAFASHSPWLESALAAGVLAAALALAGQSDGARAEINRANDALSAGSTTDGKALALFAEVVGLGSVAHESDPQARRRVIRRARKTLSTLTREALPSYFIRLAARLLSQVIAASSDHARRLLVDEAGAWFRWGDKPQVQLGNRRVLRRVLVALARHGQRAPGEGLDANMLVEIAWPGEQLLVASAQHRLHVAISSLRRLGVPSILPRPGGGYLLDPNVHVMLATAPGVLPLAGRAS